MTQTLLVRNCRLLDQPGRDSLHDVLIEGGRVVQIQAIREASTRGEVIDAGGRLAIPGLIDLHIQGAGGCDVLDGTHESLATISKTLARFGTTAFLATTVVKPLKKNAHLKIARDVAGMDLGGATMLGIHLEGPFINAKKRGGIDPASIYGSSPAAVAEVLEATGDKLRMMTVAPELPGNVGVIRELTARGVVASFGHSDATYEETQIGFAAGISHVTHLFNAMPQLHHRTPGPLAAIFEYADATLQIISDGHHLHPGVVRLIYRLAGPRRCVCITDGISGMGLPEGSYTYNGREYTTRDGAARYTDGTLIGSTTTLLEIALKFKEFTGCSLSEAIQTVTLNPARTLGFDMKKGCIAPGFDADIVLLSNELTVSATIVEGKIRYRSNG